MSGMSEELSLLQKMAGHVSDLRLAKSDPSFARFNGGVRQMEERVFTVSRQYELWLHENTDEDCRDKL